MMKINLSGKKEEPKEEPVIEPVDDVDKTVIAASPSLEKTVIEPMPPQEKPAPAVTEVPQAEPAPDESEPPPEKPKRKKKKSKTLKFGKKKLLLAAVISVFLIAIVLTQKNRIMTMLSRVPVEEVEEVVVIETQPPEPEIAVAEVVQEEPDPVFVAINIISSIIPERTWLTSFVVMYDGSYVIKGMSFTHGSAVAFGESLGGVGTITSQEIPKEVKSSESIYNFSMTGNIHNILVPEILDNIPADNLISLASGVKERGEELGITFTQFPEAGKIYGEKNLPFALSGTYEGLKEVVTQLCPVDGNTRIYHLVIRPNEVPKGFSNVTAAFSIRTVPSI